MRESELLDRIFRHNLRLPGFVTIPPGDDMAGLRIGGAEILVSTDQVIEGRHVVVGDDPAFVGRKAVTRNLSDVAAMAARPIATLAAVALPMDYGKDRAAQLLEGLRATAEVFGAPLVGGDLAIHADADAPLVCAVTILAEPAWKGARVATRHGARVGDGVFVTGALGGSFGADGLGRHRTFDPRVREGMALLRELGDALHAMIDVSDGLGRDAAHLVAQATDEGPIAIDLDAKRLPIHDGLSWQRAVGDGEDYELLFVASVDALERVEGTRVTRIGSVVARRQDEPAVVIRDGRTRVDVTRSGWEHSG